jgi:hypothetical protein
VTVNADTPSVFIRVGAKLDLGDLNKEWKESVEIAGKKPDLKALDAELKSWWDTRRAGGGGQ